MDGNRNESDVTGARARSAAGLKKRSRDRPCLEIFIITACLDSRNITVNKGPLQRHSISVFGDPVWIHNFKMDF
jgi:hypothetical protein